MILRLNFAIFAQFKIFPCLRADVSYFLCCTPRAAKEIGDVCTQAKFSLNLCEINQCATLPNVHSHLPPQTPFLILNIADLTEERRKCELKRPMNYIFVKQSKDLGLLLQLLLLCAFSLKRSTTSEAFPGNIKRTW